MAYQEGAKGLPEPEHRYAAYAEKCERGHFREHMHSQVELIFVVTGQYRFAAGEQEGIFGPGEIFIANSRETHVGTGLTPPEEEGIYYFVHLSLTKLPRGLSEELDLLLERLQSGEYRLPFRISAEQGRETGFFYRGIELADCWSRTAGCDRFKMLCRTLALWQVILEHHLYADAERRKEEEDPLVKELIAYIDQH